MGIFHGDWEQAAASTRVQSSGMASLVDDSDMCACFSDSLFIVRRHGGDVVVGVSTANTIGKSVNVVVGKFCDGVFASARP